MATAFFPVPKSATKKDFDPYDEAEVAPLDVTDLAEFHDQLGTVCATHHCSRFLDEAPILGVNARDGDSVIAKRELFPNSWTAIQSHTAGTERASQIHRRRSVTVRYCPACREAADRWFRAHLAA